MGRDDEEYLIRMALARKAHDENVVRLVDGNLRGFTHLVASRQGLFAVHTDGKSLIAHGQFYGIAIDGATIYAFEACNRPRMRTNHGRIVRLRQRDGRIELADVVARGLDNGCHQLDLIDGQLYLTDTYNQRLLRFSLDGSDMTVLHPLPAAGAERDLGYVHVNSLLAVGDTNYLLLHNDSHKTGRDSEIAVFDRAWQPTGTLPIAGQGCHSLAMLEDGTLLTCGSGTGELVGTDGSIVPICDRMTRGLSIDDDMVVVGGSVVLERALRDGAPGAVYFLDRNYRRRATIEIPGPVLEIRRIDGRDRSLSAHLGRGSPNASPA